MGEQLLQPGPNLNVKVMAWFSNCILSFYVDVNTYLCPNPGADTAIIFPDEIGTFVK